MKDTTLNENCILQSIFLDPELIHKTRIKLRAGDFQNDRNQAVFETMLTLVEKGKPIDPAMVISSASSDVSHEVWDLVQSATTSAAVDFHIDELIEARRQASLLGLAGKLSTMIRNGSESNAALEEISRNVFSMLHAQQGDKSPEALKQIALRVADSLGQPPEKLNRIMTGVPKFDRMTGGLRPGDLMVIGGSPGHGKSAIGLQVALNAALRGSKGILIFSLEMTSDDFALRAMSVAGRIHFTSLRQGYIENDEDFGQVLDATQRLGEANIQIYDKSGITVDHLSGMVRATAIRSKIDLVIVDYLQLLSAGGKKADRSREQEVSVISKTLKTLAKDLSMPVIALSQLNRDIERRQVKRPMLADLRESGAIEQDADIVAFIVRPMLYGDGKDETKSELIVAKHRHGEVGTIDMIWNGSVQTFTEKATYN